MGRLGELNQAALHEPALVIVNPQAGAKRSFGRPFDAPGEVSAALNAAGVRFELRPSESAAHAIEMASDAAQQGRQLVIAAGGDGTASEIARALAHSETTLGLMPLGTVMNVARSLSVPRDLGRAAQTIAEGRVLTMDLGRVGDHLLLEAGGVGVDAVLLGYFGRLERGARPAGVLRGLMRFMWGLGKPAVTVAHDGHRTRTHAPLVSVANGPFVGAAYAIAPQARIDDGLLDVVVFRGLSVLRVLVHLVVIAGGRALPPPPHAQILRARSVEVSTRRRRPLPVHVDGEVVGVTPVTFEVVPAALRVIVGIPEPSAIRTWEDGR